MHLRTLTVLGVSAALCGAALTVPAAAAEPASSPAAPTSARTAPGGGADLGRGARPVTRLIVQMNDRGPVTDAVTDAVAAATGVAEAKPGRRLTGGARLVALSEPVPQADAVAAAKRITARGDVAYAQPDTWMQVAVDDPRYPEQWDLSDPGTSDFSVHAPNAWSRTIGDPSVVVAVVDTGITKHPDLDANVVPGYDFIGLDDAPPFGGLNLQPYTANDGNGRDADPSDPGDWVTSSESTSANWFKGCRQEPSSWHGTHVAGTVAAVQNNQIGITGVAPGVKVQPVRAVGKCGGYLSDIADGIRWAAGGAVAGAPANPTPAQVVNVSLGGDGACDAGVADGYLQQAITYATSQDVTVVVAAGNGRNGSAVPVESDPLNPETTGATPADCQGVVVATAIGRDGRPTAYSNYVTEPTTTFAVAAPGGDATDPILSTWNTGTTRPASSGYTGYAGTSMAAPHVAAAVALLQSTRVGRDPYTVEQIKNALDPNLLSAFADGAPCGTGACGRGVLNLSVLGGLPATIPSAPRDVLAQGRASSVEVSWAAPADDGASPVLGYAVRRSDDGGATWTTVAPDVAGTSYSDTTAVAGTSYLYEVAATNAQGAGPYGRSADPTTPAAAPGPLVPTEVTPTGEVGKLTVDWNVPVDDGTGAVTGYEVRYRVGGGSWTTPAPLASTDRQLVVVPAPAGRYEVQVRATNGVPGQWSVPRLTTVTALSQDLTPASSTVRPYVDGFQDSLTLTARSNAPATGTLSIRLNGVTEVVAPINVDLTGATTQAILWPSLPTGVYVARLALTNPSSPVTAVTVKEVTVTVATSQVGTPSVTRSVGTVYPYKDGYRDTVVLTARTNVPATYSWRIRNSKGTTVRTWSYSTKTLSRAVTWNGRNSSGVLVPAGTYTVTVTTKGGTGTATSRSTTVAVSAKRLKSASFRTTLFPSSVSTTALQGSVLRKSFTYDGITKAELLVRGGADGVYDVLALSAALPSSVIPQTGVKVATCLRRSPPGNDNLLVAGYMASGTRYAGWFSALVDETQAPGLATGTGELTVAWGTVDCRTPTLSTPSAAVSGNRLRWSLFNLGPSSTGYVPVYQFTITGKRYYLA